MSDREGYLQRRDQLLMQDEEIAELKIKLAALRDAVWIVGAERGIHRYYKPMDVAIDAALSLLQERGG